MTNEPNIQLNTTHAHEDLITKENLNLNKTIGLINDEPKTTAVLSLTYKRGMVKFVSKHFKLNTSTVEWFLNLMNVAATRCGNLAPIVAINWNAVDEIENEFDYENISELFKFDNRISHIDYKLKLIKTTVDGNISFDVVFERLVSIGGRATPFGKKACRHHIASSNYDFYKKLDPSYQEEPPNTYQATTEEVQA